MSKIAWISTFDDKTTAGWRKIGSDINSKLSAVGLVQTADTGQVDWNTFNLSGINNTFVFEMWKFNDPLQVSAPIYFKLIYVERVSGSNRFMTVGAEVGVGSDGAGNLLPPTSAIGIPLSSSSISVSFSPFGSGDRRYSFVCKTDDFFGIVYQFRTSNTSRKAFLHFSITRTVDELGEPTGEGVFILKHRNISTLNLPTSTYQTINFITGNALNLTDSFNSNAALVVGNQLDTTFKVGDNSFMQAYLPFGNYNKLKPVIGLLVVRLREALPISTFTCRPVGAKLRTYISLDLGIPSLFASFDGSLFSTAMLWE